VIILIILFLFSPLQAQERSTYTIISPVLTQEQIDMNAILSKSTDTITAIKLSIKDGKYAYLKPELINMWAVTELSKEADTRRIKLGRGYAGHIYQCTIDKRVSKIINDKLY